MTHRDEAAPVFVNESETYTEPETQTECQRLRDALDKIAWFQVSKTVDAIQCVKEMRNIALEATKIPGEVSEYNHVMLRKTKTVKVRYVDAGRLKARKLSDDD